VTPTLLWALLAALAARAQAPAALPELASGRFLLQEAPEVYRPRLDTAVEKAIASLHFAFRPLARLRLRPAVYETVCGDLRLQLDAESFAVQCAGGESERRRLDGSDGTYVDDGDTYRIRIRLQGNSVEVTCAGERGGQSNTYAFEPDGRLVLHGSIFSSSLPTPLAWTLPYLRAGALEGPRTP